MWLVYNLHQLICLFDTPRYSRMPRTGIWTCLCTFRNTVMPLKTLCLPPFFHYFDTQLTRKNIHGKLFYACDWQALILLRLTSVPSYLRTYMLISVPPLAHTYNWIRPSCPAVSPADVQPSQLSILISWYKFSIHWWK